jgi:hypothetical protein
MPVAIKPPDLNLALLDLPISRDGYLDRLAEEGFGRTGSCWSVRPPI